MKIACRMFMESHMFIETDSRILAVHIQFDGKRSRMDRLQVSNSLFDDKTSDARTM